MTKSMQCKRCGLDVRYFKPRNEQWRTGAKTYRGYFRHIASRNHKSCGQEPTVVRVLRERNITW